MLLRQTDKLLVHILASIAYTLDWLKFNKKKVHFWLGGGRGLKIKTSLYTTSPQITRKFVFLGKIIYEKKKQKALHDMEKKT